MHEMQTIVNDDRGVCLSRGLTRLRIARGLDGLAGRVGSGGVGSGGSGRI